MGDAQSSSNSLPMPEQLAAELEKSNRLFWQTMAEFEPEEIESGQLGTGWSIKAAVAHVAFWDDYQRRRMEAALAGRSQAEGFARPLTDNDARAAEDAGRPWPEIEQAAQMARQRLVDFARGISPDVLAQEYQEGERQFSVLNQLQHMVRHITMHRNELQLYSGSLARWGRAGMRKMMAEQHDTFMDGMAGLTETTMTSAQVCGTWTIRDVYAHVLSWNEYCAKLLRQWPRPNPETVAEWAWHEGDTMDSMNARFLAARSDLTMIEIADGLTTEFRRMMRVFERASDEKLCSEGLTWGGPGVMCNFFYEIFVHEAEHAAQIWAFRAGLSEAEAKM